jgi:hypothetical protein
MPIQFRRDNALNWSAVNPTLAVGEPAYEINTKTMRIGDGVTPYNQLPEFGRFPAAIAGGRLSAVQSVPVPDPLGGTGLTNAESTTLFYVPYTSDKIALFSGSTWQPYTFDNTTRLALTGLLAGKNYDIFAYQVNGTVTLSAVQWASTAERSVSLVLLNGVFVRSGMANMRYIGTVRTSDTATNPTVLDGINRRFIYNHYNQVMRPMFAAYSISHTYTEANFRIWNNNPTGLPILQLVQGFRQPVRVDMHAYVRYGGIQPRMMPGTPWSTTLASTASAGSTTIVLTATNSELQPGWASVTGAGVAPTATVSGITNSGLTITLSQPLTASMAAGSVIGFGPVQHLMPAAYNLVAPSVLSGNTYMTVSSSGHFFGAGVNGGFMSIVPGQFGSGQLAESPSIFNNYTLTASMLM